jgi:hypothetical protein
MMQTKDTSSSYISGLLATRCRKGVSSLKSHFLFSLSALFFFLNAVFLKSSTLSGCLTVNKIVKFATNFHVVVKSTFGRRRQDSGGRREVEVISCCG